MEKVKQFGIKALSIVLAIGFILFIIGTLFFMPVCAMLFLISLF
jgi:hypothetical protein